MPDGKRKPGNPNIVEAGRATRFGGERGNLRQPGGKPPGPKLSHLIAAELAKPSVKGSPVTRGQQIAATLVALAAAGDVASIREVLDRTEGKSVARTEQGDVGAFDAELTQDERQQLRAALRVVRAEEADDADG